MEFYPYATGRALHFGYGFYHGAADLPPALTTACQGRGLSKLRGGSVIFELRPLDSHHTALQMTQVTQFGGKGANFCYTHSLISKEFAEPEALLQLLQRENFLNDESFLALEAQKERGEQFPIQHLDVSHEGGSHSVSLPVQCSKAAMCALVNYIWEQCEKNSKREKVTPATIVLPAGFSHQDMLDFVGKVILPVLPDSMRRQFSVVFGCNRDFSGSFPSNTVCFVIQEQETTYKPVFEPFSAASLPNEAIAITPGKLLLSKALGESTEDNKLYHSMLSTLPVACRESYATANTLLRLCLSLEKTGVTVNKLQEDWDLYSKLSHELAHRLPAGTSIYDMFLPLETVMLEQVQKHLPQFTIPELTKILMISGWGQAERKKLLDSMLAHIGAAEDALVELRDCMKNRNCQYAFVMDQLHEQLKRVLMDNIRQEPTEERFERLWTLLWERPNDVQGMQALLACAGGINHLSTKVADLIAKIAPQLFALDNSLLNTQLMQLFESNPSHSAMLQILEQLDFRYDRAQWKQWDAVERSWIADQFAADLKRVKNAEEPLERLNVLYQQQAMWKKRYHEKFKRDWICFPSEICNAVETVQKAACSALHSCTTLSLYHQLMTQQHTGWYHEIVLQQAGQELAKNLDGIFEQEDPNAFGIFPSVMDAFHLPEDSRVTAIKIAANLKNSQAKEASAQMAQLNALYSAYAKRAASSVSLYAQKCAHEMAEPAPHQTDQRMLWYLMQHIAAPKEGWKAFFEAQNWTPAKGASPWQEKHLWLLNVLRYTYERLSALGAASVWQEELLLYLNEDPKWKDFIQKMKDDKAYSRFMKNSNAKAPNLEQLLQQ